MAKMSFIRLYRQHIIGTPKKSFVLETAVFVGNLKSGVLAATDLTSAKVHITSKVLKHIYDDRPPHHVDSIIDNLKKVIERPDKIFKNKKGSSKTADFAFLKNFTPDPVLVFIQKGKGVGPSWIVTGFLNKDKSYLKEYELIWEF